MKNNKGKIIISVLLFIIIVLLVTIISSLVYKMINNISDDDIDKKELKIILEYQEKEAKKQNKNSSNEFDIGKIVQYDPISNNKCSEGETCYKWRIITTEEDKITLQLNHNIVNLSRWSAKSEYNDDINYGLYGNVNKGPITALKRLEEATSSWSDELLLNYTYDTSMSEKNYGILTCIDGKCKVSTNDILLTSNLKARLITAEEVTKIVTSIIPKINTVASTWTLKNDTSYFFSNINYRAGTKKYIRDNCINNRCEIGSTKLAWLIENTEYDEMSGATTNTYEDNNSGYWTLSPVNEILPCYSWAISSQGYLALDGLNNDRYFGLRPVITIPKSILY